MRYRDGYKYQLHEEYRVKISIAPVRTIFNYFITLTDEGELVIRKGYAWDGCSGPTWDDKTNMRAGLVHDSLYQLLREGKLHSAYRDDADRIFQDICIEDGMCSFRAWLFYKGVRIGGVSSAKRQSDIVYEAP